MEIRETQISNAVFLEVYTDYRQFQDNKILILPLESFVTFSVYKVCSPSIVQLYFVPVENNGNVELSLKIEEEVNFLDKKVAPWSVALCSYPVISYEDRVITGLCAVARHICKYRSSSASPQEHEEGLLGFRKSCLQAPNEVSIWTKFCEIDLFKTVKEILSVSAFNEIPSNMVRFENHLNKPVRVHNVYKIARDIQKGNSINPITLPKENSKDDEIKLKDTKRLPKSRKWKSKVKKDLEIDCSVKIEDLNVSHQFAEGPYLTLADLIILPLVYILSQHIGKKHIESHLPLTQKWLQNILSIPELHDVKKLFSCLKCKPLLCLSDIPVPKYDDISLYKCDPKRHNPKKRLFTKEGDIENALSLLMDGMELTVEVNNLDLGSITWENIPDGANPTAGHLPDDRMMRKSQQLENLALAVMSIASEGDLIVDFCCGSGHLGILLAFLLPKCTIILLENKEQSLLRAHKRVHDMNLKNVYFYQCNLDFFIGKFDIGIGLHACGIASDLVLDKCLKANAKFVLSPCCYGSLHSTDRFVYPRSKRFVGLPIDKYLCIGHTADQTHEEHPLTVRGARCMAIIDSDRAHLAQELGYKVTLSRLKPLTCTPKNNLLIGEPAL